MTNLEIGLDKLQMYYYAYLFGLCKRRKLTGIALDDRRLESVEKF